MLSATKALAAKRYWDFAQVPTYLLVKWTDAIAYTRLDNLPEHGWKLAMHGRFDRNDKDDYEPVVYIPTAWFTKIDLLDNSDT